MPTFKFKEGTSEYVFTKPKKLPSYTDRVIYKKSHSSPEESARMPSKVIVEEYDSLKYHLSDHQPVICVVRVLKRSS